MLASFTQTVFPYPDRVRCIRKPADHGNGYVVGGASDVLHGGTVIPHVVRQEFVFFAVDQLFDSPGGVTVRGGLDQHVDRTVAGGSGNVQSLAGVDGDHALLRSLSAQHVVRIELVFGEGFLVHHELLQRRFHVLVVVGVVLGVEVTRVGRAQQGKGDHRVHARPLLQLRTVVGQAAANVKHFVLDGETRFDAAHGGRVPLHCELDVDATLHLLHTGEAVGATGDEADLGDASFIPAVNILVVLPPERLWGARVAGVPGVSDDGVGGSDVHMNLQRGSIRAHLCGDEGDVGRTDGEEGQEGSREGADVQCSEGHGRHEREGARSAAGDRGSRS